MNRKTYEKLRKIQMAEEVHPDAIYYSIEYERHGNSHFHYYNLYNSNFELSESVKIVYTNSIDHLRRIVTESQKNDISFSAYTLEPIGNGFYHVISDGNTTDVLKSVCESVKPANWK